MFEKRKALYTLAAVPKRTEQVTGFEHITTICL
jgi:hypothetical protein